MVSSIFTSGTSGRRVPELEARGYHRMDRQGFRRTKRSPPVEAWPRDSRRPQTASRSSKMPPAECGFLIPRLGSYDRLVNTGTSSAAATDGLFLDQGTAGTLTGSREKGLGTRQVPQVSSSPFGVSPSHQSATTTIFTVTSSGPFDVQFVKTIPSRGHNVGSILAQQPDGPRPGF